MKTLKLPDRAEVTPEFIDLMILIYSAWLTNIQRVVHGNGLQRYAPFIQRVLPIVRRQSPDLHSGLDYEITRLRGNPYVQKFMTYEHNGLSYLLAITKDITLSFYLDKKVMGYLGKYRIFIPTTTFTANDMRLVHMIPENNPRSVYRHPHHYLNLNDRRGDRNLRLPEGMHPLDAVTGNCWGDTSSPIKGSIDNPDVPVLFSLLGKHLSVFGISPPVHMDELDFTWRLP